MKSLAEQLKIERELSHLKTRFGRACYAIILCIQNDVKDHHPRRVKSVLRRASSDARKETGIHVTDSSVKRLWDLAYRRKYVRRNEQEVARLNAWSNCRWNKWAGNNRDKIANSTRKKTASRRLTRNDIAYEEILKRPEAMLSDYMHNLNSRAPSHRNSYSSPHTATHHRWEDFIPSSSMSPLEQLMAKEEFEERLKINLTKRVEINKPRISSEQSRINKLILSAPAIKKNRGKFRQSVTRYSAEKALLK